MFKARMSHSLLPMAAVPGSRIHWMVLSESTPSTLSLIDYLRLFNSGIAHLELMS